jgi:hypothetical protein
MSIVATHIKTALAFCVTIVAPDFSGCDTVNLSSGLTQIVIVWAESVMQGKTTLL